MVDGEVRGDPDRVIEGVHSLENAGPSHLAFVTNPRYRRKAAASRAGALLVAEVLEGVDRDYLVADDPYYALACIMRAMHPPASRQPGMHETAIVEEGAEIDSGAYVGPFCLVRRDSRIGNGAVLHSHVVVGEGSVVGDHSILYPHVVLYPGCILGQGCILHSGVVLGSDGFGYALHEGTHVKLEHAGRVVLEEHVEIGANSTVDRALLDETRIGSGSKIDNLVQVAHNVRLGQRCLLISQSGIAGSTSLGDDVILAGQAGLAGHLELGNGVQVAAKSAVFKSVEAGRRVAGIPAGEAGAWRRQQALVARLGEMSKRLRRLEARIMGTEEGAKGEDGES
jgi:UDP-3-O-[3-hydroxymyristoyl] glucosamine N-acyltransferase